MLTEAATGAYVVTPILAALAGARVLAYAKDTRYGSREEVFALLNATSRSLGAPAITTVSALDPKTFAAADLITNSGHLRPLNAERLQSVKPGAVLSLMYEAWECREADLDLAFCHERAIRVGGTNERHPDVDVFGYLGDMAMKLMLDAGACPYNSTVVLICNNDFGPYIARTLAKVCRRLGIVDTVARKADYQPLLNPGKVDWLSAFPTLEPLSHYLETSAVIFTASPFENDWAARGGVDLAAMKRFFPEAVLLRFAGHLDTKDLANHGIAFHPKEVRAGHMGVLPSDVGVEPILRLQAAGLKVGQLMLEGKTYLRGTELVQPLVPHPTSTRKAS